MIPRNRLLVEKGEKYDTLVPLMTQQSIFIFHENETNGAYG